MNRFYYLCNSNAIPIHPFRGELMDKTVNYLQVLWKQSFAYLNGCYDMYNSITECFIRLLANEYKNSLFFVCSGMANVSMAYHTLLSTCCLNGWAIHFGISEEILPRNCQREKG